MSDRIAVLTPPGTGAIATIAVVGPTAWDRVRQRFRKPLPETPPPGRFWFGTLGDDVGDEVVVAATEPWVEIHCHGGQRLVRWIVGLFVADGCEEVRWQALIASPMPRHDRPWACDSRALDPLTRATTVRTATILLAQYHGAFAAAVRDTLLSLDITNLARFAPLGRHLVEPWKVAVAGPPNVGKSSLINALAGYQRSIVAPVPGTTRDVVTVRLAFDGWPVELADTAGLREAVEAIESEGVERAKRAVADADLVVWVMDYTDPKAVLPPAGLTDEPILTVRNKADLPGQAGDADDLVSATTGDGIPGLAARIAGALVPIAPDERAAVPFTPALADAIERAVRLLQSGQPDAARESLTACLACG